MEPLRRKSVILIVEDDEEDRRLLEEAARQAGISIPFVCLENGEQLLDFLNQRNAFNHQTETYHPLLIFLDLNMPLLSGKKVLVEIKRDERLKMIPIILFTTSASQEDITWAYERGASSLIIKPFSYNALLDIMTSIKNYWCETVELP